MSNPAPMEVSSTLLQDWFFFCLKKHRFFGFLIFKKIMLLVFLRVQVNAPSSACRKQLKSSHTIRCAVTLKIIDFFTEKDWNVQGKGLGYNIYEHGSINVR